MPDPDIEALRAFTRFYTARVGVLSDRLLGGPFSPPEARIVYEVGAQPRITASHLAQGLALDQGYVSRLVTALLRKGVLMRTPAPDDRRRQHLDLSTAGRELFAAIEAQSRQANATLLAGLDPDERRRLRAALADVMALLGGPAATSPVILRPHRAGDIGWVIARHGALYAQEYSLDSSFEALVAGIAGEFLQKFDPARECCWIAERDGRNLGSAFVVRQDEQVAKLRLVLVEPAARGLGLGRQLVRACIAFARAAGYQRMTLWTNDILHAARKIYQDEGFVLVSEEKHHSFGRDLVGQNWDLDLHPAARN